ncbi:MAG: Holliday junction DNA helicase RuvA [Candidatus Marinamargulisbacteria bacterium]|jgi:Holliday junction DNA helicase RuvA
MIHHLKGTVSDIQTDYVVIDVNGVGYQVYPTAPALIKLPPKGESVSLYIYHHIREDQQTLFGFSTTDERKFFELLTSVSGVGPKLGIKILSSLSPDDLVQFILKEDVPSLTAIPGLGKKTSEKLIIDLKDKLPKLYSIDTSKLSKTKKSASIAYQEDLSLALKTLGYSTDEIKKAILSTQESLSENLSLEENLKTLLNYL